MMLDYISDALITLYDNQDDFYLTVVVIIALILFYFIFSDNEVSPFNRSKK